MAGFLAAYSYMQTTILLGFFGSVLVLVHTLATKPSKARAWMAAGFLVLLLVVGGVFTFSWQSVYIDHIRGGSPKEYMEVLTSFGLCVYAIDVYIRLFVRNINDKSSLIKRVLAKA
jgi:protein-S-isoprenylcysteine O-methyltransferase Ste14